MRIRHLALLGVLGSLGGGLLASSGVAHATSWLSSNKGTVTNGALVSSGTTDPYTEGFKAMTVVNPGGWGAPTKPEDMTVESLKLLTARMKKDNQTIKEMFAPPQAPAGVARASAVDSVLLRQQIANTIKPLTLPSAQPPKGSVAGGYVTPRIPVEEWNAISGGAEQSAPAAQ